MLASSLDDTLRLLDKDTGEMLNRYYTLWSLDSTVPDYYIHYFTCSYKGHKSMDYKLDSCLTHDDAHVVSGSEDGRVCFWDLVEVKYPNNRAQNQSGLSHN